MATSETSVMYALSMIRSNEVRNMAPRAAGNSATGVPVGKIQYSESAPVPLLPTSGASAATGC